MFQRPGDNEEKSFLTYLSRNIDGNDRIRLEIIPYSGASIGTFIYEFYKRKEVASVKKLNRLKHTPSDEMKKIYADEPMYSAKIEEEYGTIFQACEICASSGRPRN